MDAASRVRDCFPPTPPMSNALPRSMHSKREMRIMCFNASSRTRSSFMLLLVSLNAAWRAMATALSDESDSVDS